MMMKPYKKMGVITDKERKTLEKIDYSGDFDRELAKFEKIAVPKAKGMDKTGYGPNTERNKSNRSKQARDMMRTSKPEVRETKQDIVRRKKKEFGIAGQLTESELEAIKDSLSSKEYKILTSK